MEELFSFRGVSVIAIATIIMIDIKEDIGTYFIYGYRFINSSLGF